MFWWCMCVTVHQLNGSQSFSATKYEGSSTLLTFWYCQPIKTSRLIPENICIDKKLFCFSPQFSSHARKWMNSFFLHPGKYLIVWRSWWCRPVVQHSLWFPAISAASPSVDSQLRLPELLQSVGHRNVLLLLIINQSHTSAGLYASPESRERRLRSLLYTNCF